MSKTKNLILFALVSFLGISLLIKSEYIKEMYQLQDNIINLDNKIYSYENNYNILNQAQIQRLIYNIGAKGIVFSKNIKCFNNFNCSKKYIEVKSELSNLLYSVIKKIKIEESLRNIIIGLLFSCLVGYFMIFSKNLFNKNQESNMITQNYISIENLIKLLNKKGINSYYDKPSIDTEFKLNIIYLYEILRFKDKIDKIKVQKNKSIVIELHTTEDIKLLLPNNSYRIVRQEYSKKVA